MSDCDGDEISIEDGDCDDGNPDIFPGQTELCDGLDNDCDNNDEALAEGATTAQMVPENSLCIGGIRR